MRLGQQKTQRAAFFGRIRRALIRKLSAPRAAKNAKGGVILCVGVVEERERTRECVLSLC